MPDQIFANPRLVEIYDIFDGTRRDLDHYYALAKELDAQSILDIGCGTGCFACGAAERGFEIIGVDPAKASLDFARQKPWAEKVRWIHGTASDVEVQGLDLALMTGNVAQVFITDPEWEETIRAIHRCLKPNGYFIFEVRAPKKEAWKEWHRQSTLSQKDIPEIGKVEAWCDLVDVSGELVKFRWNYSFESDGALIQSDSTLRFRSKDAIQKSLIQAGYDVVDIRDAPDRPGKEFVFLCKKREA